MHELKEKLARALKAARDIAAKAEAEGRDFDAEERENLKKALDEAAEIKKQIKARQDADGGLTAALKELGDDLAGILGDDEKPATPGPGQPGEGSTLGEKFLNSPEFTAWMKSFGGRIPDNLKGIQSPPVSFRGLKGLITGDSSTSAGALVVPGQSGIFDTGIFQRPLTIRDLVTNGTTTSDAVEYVRVTGFTNSAASVPEAVTAAAVGGGVTEADAGVKPESGITMQRVSAPVVTIAHWIPATRRALSDAGQLRTLIDNFLRYGLEEELEDQMVNGDGMDDELEGLATVSNVQVQTFETDALVTTRKARTKVRVGGRATPTAYVMHPLDWEQIELSRENDNGSFYYGGPASLAVPRLWGLPVVESEAVPQGTAYVADWRQAVLWDREQASISVSDSHADFFVRNLVAILAELRVAFGVIRPQAFCQIALSAGSSS